MRSDDPPSRASMTRSDPPDWALPSWDTIPADPASAARGTYGVRILGVSEATRTIRAAVRSDPRLADLWVEGEIGRVTKPCL